MVVPGAGKGLNPGVKSFQVVRCKPRHLPFCYIMRRDFHYWITMTVIKGTKLVKQGTEECWIWMLCQHHDTPLERRG